MTTSKQELKDLIDIHFKDCRIYDEDKEYYEDLIYVYFWKIISFI